MKQLIIGLSSFVLIFGLFGKANVLAQSDQANDLANHPFMKVDLLGGDFPSGLPDVHPDGTATFAAKVDLGRRLFFETRLSGDGTVACATCHLPEFGFSVNEATPKGAYGRVGRRNPPSVFNRQFGKLNFWDGRTETLEEQALEPIENELELANTVDNVLEFLKNDASYQKDFANAFDDGVTRSNLALAIASFERVLLSGDSPIDAFVTARKSELTKSQRQGLWLYESKGGCWQCHAGKTYTDEAFHNTGVSWGAEPLDLGRFEVTKDETHKGQFKTPTLRNVALTAPYMHDGSIATLREVIEFYNEGGVKNPHLDSKMKPLNLTEEEITDLVAFLEALTGKHSWDDVVMGSSDEEDSEPDAADGSDQ